MTAEHQPWLGFLVTWRHVSVYEQAVQVITHLERCLELPEYV